MTMTETSRIDKTIEIAAPVERVWRALTSTKEVSEWFKMTIEGEFVPGRDVWMTVTQPGEYHGMRFPVKIVEMTAPRRFVWEWHPGAIEPGFDYSKEPRTTVAFTLEPSGRGTKVTVSETGFDALAIERRAKAFKDNTQGWTEVMVWLQQHAEKTN